MGYVSDWDAHAKMAAKARAAYPDCTEAEDCPAAEGQHFIGCGSYPPRKALRERLRNERVARLMPDTDPMRADVNDPAVNGQWADRRAAWYHQDQDWWSGFAAEMATGVNPADTLGGPSDV